MRYLENETYRQDIETAVEHTAGFDSFSKKKVLILGASGLIGSFITDCFLYADQNLEAEIDIYASSRRKERLRSRFGDEQEGCLHFIEGDVSELNTDVSFDYIIHAASYGHPKAFRETPVEVLMTNVAGTKKVLDIAVRNPHCRVLYVSSGEVQGQIDHLSARACYPMGKRAAETLCIAYMQEYGVDAVIARLSHTYGANMAAHDNRAAAQFLTLAAEGKNIRMYSAGEQIRSFSYVADCASGLLTVLSGGTGGMVYGISSGDSCRLIEFAGMCADAGGCRVVVQTPDDIEKLEISPIADQLVSSHALEALGWHAAFSIESGIKRSIRIMRETYGDWKWNLII